jgi:hypothetical protein
VIVDVGGESLDGGKTYIVIVSRGRRTGRRRAKAALAIANVLGVRCAGDELVVR